MTSTRETENPRDHPYDDSQKNSTYPDTAPVPRVGQGTGIDAFLDDMVRTPGEDRLREGIDWNNYVEEIMVHAVQTTDSDNNDNSVHHLSSELTGDDQDFDEGEHVTYMIANLVSTAVLNSLIDRGANGGVAGDDMRPIKFDRDRTLNVTGIDNHQMPELKIGTFGAYAETQDGPVILIFNQYGYHGKGKTIHAAIQLEDNGTKVDDKSVKMGGTQTLVTTEGHIIPLDVERGLVYLKLRPFTDEEYVKYPTVIMTQDRPWHPRRYDHKLSDNQLWKDSQPTAAPVHPGYDAFGDYIYSQHVHHIIPSILRQVDVCRRQRDVIQDLNVNYDVNYKNCKLRQRDYERFRLFFLNQPVEVVKNTFNATEQRYNAIPASPRIPRSTQTAHPAANTPRRHEAVATDTVFGNVPALCCGKTAAQIFVGKTSFFISVHPSNDGCYP